MVGKGPVLYVLPGKQDSFMKPHSLTLGQAQTQRPKQTHKLTPLGHIPRPSRVPPFCSDTPDRVRVLLNLFYYYISFGVLQTDSESYACWESATPLSYTPSPAPDLSKAAILGCLFLSNFLTVQEYS